VQEQVGVTVGESRLNAVEDLEEEERSEERDDSEERIRPLSRETARIRMRMVIELSGDTQHSAAGLLGHAWMIVEDSGDRTDADVRFSSYVVDCDGHRRNGRASNAELSLLEITLLSRCQDEMRFLKRVMR
jgi:hypothetical protein